MSAQHTPGPWGLSHGINTWVMAGQLHVASVPRAYDGDWSHANARLIAAAPELLDEGRNALHLLRALGHEDTAEAQALAAAIAKATGGAA